MVSHEPVCAIDIFPTICALTGVAAPAGVDGCDLLPWLRGESPFPARDLFWEMEKQTAVRRGNYKLILHPFEDEDRDEVCEVFLADLEADPSERHNLAEEHPALTAALTQAARSWRAGIEEVWEEQFAQNYRHTT